MLQKEVSKKINKKDNISKIKISLLFILVLLATQALYTQYSIIIITTTSFYNVLFTLSQSTPNVIAVDFTKLIKLRINLRTWGELKTLDTIMVIVKD